MCLNRICIVALVGIVGSTIVATAFGDVLTPGTGEQLLWLRADAGLYDSVSGGSATTNGGEVCRWEDQSGHGYNALGDVDSGYTPNLSSTGGPGGTATLAFTRISNGPGNPGDWLHLPNAACPGDAFTAFVVYSAADTGGGPQNLLTRAFNFGSFCMKVDANGKLVSIIGGNYPGDGQYDNCVQDTVTSTTSTVANGFHVATAGFAGGAVGTHTLAVDGTIQGTGSLAYHLDYDTRDYFGIGINASNQGGNYRYSPLSGSISEIILYNRALTSGEMNEVGSYLENKYVPEPSVIVLLVTGLTGLVAYAWRRQR